MAAALSSLSQVIMMVSVLHKVEHWMRRGFYVDDVMTISGCSFATSQFSRVEYDNTVKLLWALPSDLGFGL